MLPRVVLTPLKVNGAHVESASGMCKLVIAMLLPQGLGTCLPLAAALGLGSAVPVESGALLWQSARRGGETRPSFRHGLCWAPFPWPPRAVVRVL